MNGAPSHEIKGAPHSGVGCETDAFMNARAELLPFFPPTGDVLFHHPEFCFQICFENKKTLHIPVKCNLFILFGFCRSLHPILESKTHTILAVDRHEIHQRNQCAPYSVRCPHALRKIFSSICFHVSHPPLAAPHAHYIHMGQRSLNLPHFFR